MEEQPRLFEFFLHKGDRWILIGILLGIFVLFASQMLSSYIISSSESHGVMIEIYHQKELLVLPVEALPTEKESQWVLEGPAGRLNLVYAPLEGFYVRSASCPDHSCVYMGLINKVNQSIVCVPNEIVIRLILDVKGEEATLDGVL